MTTLEPNPILCIAAPDDLNASNVSAFREQARALLQREHRRLDVNLSETIFIDSSGLGALVSLNKMMALRGGTVRLIHPTQTVLQLIELTRMHRLFEIVRA